MRVSSVISPASFSGTLKSTRMKMRLPLRSRSRTESFGMVLALCQWLVVRCLLPGAVAEEGRSEAGIRLATGVATDDCPRTRDTVAAFCSRLLPSIPPSLVRLLPAPPRPSFPVSWPPLGPPLQSLAGDEGDQIAHTAGVSPLVVVPGDNLDQRAVDHLGEAGVDHG